MHRLVTCLLVLPGLVAFGCAAARPVRAPQAAVAAPAGVHRGWLALGHELRSFQPCEGGPEHWVVDQTGELRGVYEALSTQPYQRIYVELRGDLDPPPREGFGANYGAQLTVFQLVRAAAESRGCAEDPSTFRFRARGNEPFWSLDISESGLVFAQLGGPQGLLFPYNPPQLHAATLTYRSSIETPAPLAIRVDIAAQRCLDTMSGEHFGYRARVSLSGQTVEGCAYQGQSPTGPIRYDLQTVDKKLDGCGPDGTEACAWVRLDFPEVVSGPTAESRRRINEVIDRWLSRPLRDDQAPVNRERLVADLFSEYRDFKKQFPDSAQRWSLRRHASVVHSSERVLSVKLLEVSDLGGAHPNSVTRFVNFRVQSGAEIGLDAVIADSARPELERIAEKHFREARRLAADASLVAAGFRFTEDRFSLNDNFAVLSRELVFLFNPYEIGPYVLGSTELRIPYGEIAALLRPDAGIP